MIKYESDPVVIELLVKIVDEGSGCEALKARLDKLKAFNEKESIEKRIAEEEAEAKEKREEMLIRAYKASGGKLKRYRLGWFGQPLEFGYYLESFSFEIKTIVSDRFQELIKNQDYDDINYRYEYLKLKKEIHDMFYVSKVKVRNS